MRSRAFLTPGCFKSVLSFAGDGMEALFVTRETQCAALPQEIAIAKV